MVKNPPANAEAIREQVLFLDWEDLLEKGMATHSSILVWRIPWTEEPGGLVTKGQTRLKWAHTHTAATAESLQSCPTLCDPTPGILQARTLEWAAISFSNAGKGKVNVKLLSHVQLFTTPWTAAYQAPPSMGFSRQEYWSGILQLM